jgi:hypothetical protein
MSDKRYFVDRSESGDYYCIPLDMAEEWEQWQEEGYIENDTPPEPIYYIGGWASAISFTDPKPR